MRYSLIGYLIGDGIKNIAKNKKSIFASMTIMLVTMLIVGIFFVIGENFKAIMKKVEMEYPLEVYLDNDITVAEKDNLESQIRSIEYVSPDIVYVTKAEAYEKAKQKTGGDFVEGYTPEVNPYPTEFIIKFTNLEKIEEVARQIEQLDNVIGTTIDDQSKNNTEILVNLNTVLNIAIIVSTGILGAFSVLIIANTIKLTVHARRKEISIMKYVGATNNFIRAPFMVEGVIIGTLTSFIAIVILGGIYVWFKNDVVGKELTSWLAQYNISSGIELLSFSQLFWQVMIIYLFLGTVIGVLGSAISMKKYLKV